MNAPIFDLSDTDRALIDAFEQNVFARGGRVRDTLFARFHGLELARSDEDYVVTGHPLPTVLERLARIGRVEVVGASFPVIKLTVNGRTSDVSLPRRETGGRGHADPDAFGPEVDVYDDLARCDFTINGNAVRLRTQELISLPNAIADIKARRLRFIAPDAPVNEPVRIWRGVQFAARLNLTCEHDTFGLMVTHARRTKTTPPERIAAELEKLLTKSPKPSLGLELARRVGLLDIAIPELIEACGVEQNRAYHAYDVWGHTLEATDAAKPQLLARLAALFHDVGKPRAKRDATFYNHEIIGADMTKEILGRLQFSNEMIDRTERLVRQHMYSADRSMSDAAKRRLIRRIGEDNLELQFELRAADVIGHGPDSCFEGRTLAASLQSNEDFANDLRVIQAQRPALDVKALAVNGHHILEYVRTSGLRPSSYRGGAEVGRILNSLLEHVTDDPSLNSEERLRGLLPQVAQGVCRAATPVLRGL